MESYPQEGALRGGHIPGAVSKPWKSAANDDGTFKPADELVKIYRDELGLETGDDIIAYCRIGERSSHTWFVLHHLLGYPQVRNYDGSWTEWGNLVRAPIARGDRARRRGLTTSRRADRARPDPLASILELWLAQPAPDGQIGNHNSKIAGSGTA